MAKTSTNKAKRKKNTNWENTYNTYFSKRQGTYINK